MSRCKGGNIALELSFIIFNQFFLKECPIGFIQRFTIYLYESTSKLPSWTLSVPIFKAGIMVNRSLKECDYEIRPLFKVMSNLNQITKNGEIKNIKSN